MIGRSLVFAILYVWLDARYDGNPFLQAFIYSAFFLGVVFLSELT